MAVGLLRRLAGRAPVPVCAVAGAGARTALLALRADDRLRLVASPRHASVLLVGGVVTPALAEVVAHVHDQLPEPRAAVWWGGDDPAALDVDGVVTAPADADVVPRLCEVDEELRRGARASTPPAGPAANPVSWRGEGPHGQGGEGMMGGHPYGREMAMPGPDVRDGLQLDRISLPAGPALPGLPPGLVLQLELQGDVIVHAEPPTDLLAGPDRAGAPLPSVDAPLDAAVTRPVAVADIERARGRVHLLRLAEALSLHGLDAAARRVARLAVGLDVADARRVARLRAWLRRGAPLHGAAAGVGRIDADAVERLDLRGVAARAAGVAVDARDADPAYRAAGFAVRTRGGGDALARWGQRADEALQALELAEAAGSATTRPDHPLEDPRDPGGAAAALPELLVGCEWGDAITLIASLDLDADAAPAPAATRQGGS